MLESASGQLEAATIDHGRRFRSIGNGAWSMTMIAPHVACLRGPWVTIHGKVTTPRGDFAAR